MSPDFHQLLQWATQAAQAAGTSLLSSYQKPLKIKEKIGSNQRTSFVTHADLEAQQRAFEILKEKTPDFSFLSEESEPEIRNHPGRWILDPLDGTTNFIHGFPMFCVSIAAQWKGNLAVGVIHHPILQDTYTAIRGQGAFLNGTKISVSSTKMLPEALLATGFHYDLGTSETSGFHQLAKNARGIRRTGSAALDLAYTAQGIFDGFWEQNLALWDVAAGCLIVEEAGGVVTDFEGNLFTDNFLSLIACNKMLHQAILSFLHPY